MKALLSVARQGSAGKVPDGRSYSHVADYIDSVGYGGIKKGNFNAVIPAYFWSHAVDLANFLNFE